MSAPALWQMRGGVSPPAHKARSNASAIRCAGTPDELVFPLPQRRVEAIPLVAVGQRVRKGEPIARAGDADGAPLHASTSGTITAIDTRPVAHPAAALATCIVLQPDGRDSWYPLDPLPGYRAAQPLALIERIRAAGVVGAGGAGFPAARKLLDRTGAPVTIDTLIINGAECEPYITADDRLMRERSTDIVAGIRVLHHILQPQRVLVGIEDDKPEALAAMRAACADDGWPVIAVPTLYPTGGEAQLIHVLTGREVPCNGIPPDVGALCFNVGTAAAIAGAVIRGEPMLSRIVTIAGSACRDNGNFEVLIGTPLQHLLTQAGFEPARCTRLVAGGGMMGLPVDDPAVPVGRASHCFIAATADDFPPQPEPLPCIRCGYCADACPVALQPQLLYLGTRSDDSTGLQHLHLDDCIECGACDFICPSHIPLVAAFRAAKRDSNVSAYTQQQAVVARQRFAQHQVRLERDRRERDAARQQRLRGATDATTPATAPTSGKRAAIQAAIARVKARKQGSPIQRPAVAAALQDNTPPAERLRRRIHELQVLQQDAEPAYRDRLQRALDDLARHLADVEAHPDTEPPRVLIERALAAARDAEQGGSR